eukprot:12925_1
MGACATTIPPERSYNTSKVARVLTPSSSLESTPDLCIAKVPTSNHVLTSTAFNRQLRRVSTAQTKESKQMISKPITKNTDSSMTESAKASKDRNLFRIQSKNHWNLSDIKTQEDEMKKQLYKLNANTCNIDVKQETVNTSSEDEYDQILMDCD